MRLISTDYKEGTRTYCDMKNHFIFKDDKEVDQVKCTCEADTKHRPTSTFVGGVECKWTGD